MSSKPSFTASGSARLFDRDRKGGVPKAQQSPFPGKATRKPWPPAGPSCAQGNLAEILADALGRMIAAMVAAGEARRL